MILIADVIRLIPCIRKTVKIAPPTLGRLFAVNNRARTKKSATVTKVIKERVIEKHGVSEVEKAQIELHDGDDLYREIRIQNELEDESGQKVKLKPGEDVDVTIEVSPEHNTKKQS